MKMPDAGKYQNIGRNARNSLKIFNKTNFYKVELYSVKVRDG